MPAVKKQTAELKKFDNESMSLLVRAQERFLSVPEQDKFEQAELLLSQFFEVAKNLPEEDQQKLVQKFDEHFPSKIEQNTELYGLFYDASMNTALGELLVSARKHMGLTQKQVSEIMENNQQNIIRLEKGRTQPNLSTLSKYTKALGAKLKISLTL